jgi:DNA-binding NtrC family response regulator
MSTTSKPCLLVVDDEPEICDSVYYLVNRKYRVLRATSAADAVELMASNHVQIIMTDQRMPRVTGVEMLQKLLTLTDCRY